MAMESGSAAPLSPGPRTETVAGFSVRDTATGVDQLGFKPYVEAVAAFLTNEETKPPLTMSVEGEWGSGKSSFMLMLEGAIDDHYKKLGKQAKIVRFNAWRYDKDEAMWAAFALLLTESLARKLPPLKRIRAHCALQYQRFDWKKGWFAVVRFSVLALFLLFTTIASGKYLVNHPNSINPFSEVTKGGNGVSPPAGDKPDEALLKLLITAAGGGGYVLLLAMLVKKAVDMVGNPFAIDLNKFNGSLSYEEKVSFVEHFHKDFSKILAVYSEDQTVFVFIDDLDRCELPKAADMMQGLNLLMSDSCKAIYVLGLDRDKIAAGLAAKYEKLFTYLNDQRTTLAGGANTTTQSGLDFGFDFLEKFIQIPYQIPKPSNRDIARLFVSPDEQAGAAPSTENVDPGILFQTKVDSPLVRDIISMVAPSFNHNPRRIKQFVNCFRLCAITASQTGLFGPPRSNDYSPLTVEQLGKMVAICLRWPLLVGDALQVQSLLRLLEKQAIKPTNGYGVDDRIGGIADYWLRKDRLVALLRYGMLEPNSSDFSLSGFDLERYLQVSPALSPPRQDAPPSNPARPESLHIKFGEPTGFTEITQIETPDPRIETHRVDHFEVSQVAQKSSDPSQPAP